MLLLMLSTQKMWHNITQRKKIIIIIINYSLFVGNQVNTVSINTKYTLSSYKYIEK